MVINAWVISLVAILLAPVLLIRFRKRWAAAFNLAITNREPNHEPIRRTIQDARFRLDFIRVRPFLVYSDESLRVELDFDQLTGLFGRRYPLPFLNGIMSRLR
jgi:hypothetical protein